MVSRARNHIVITMAGVAVLLLVRRPQSLPRSLAGVSVATLILLLVDQFAPPLAAGLAGLTVGSILTTPPYPQVLRGVPQAIAQIFEDIANYEPSHEPFGKSQSRRQSMPASIGDIRSTGDVEGLAPEMLAAIGCVERASGQALYITSGYRSSAEQAELYRRYREGRGNLAAPPGRSKHEQGRAIDVDSASQRILQEYGASCGLRAAVAGEPWHWEV